MNMQFKERLVGGLVLIGLLVIWLPFFMGGEDEKTPKVTHKKTTVQSEKTAAEGSVDTAETKTTELPLQIKPVEKPVDLTATPAKSESNKTYETALEAPKAEIPTASTKPLVLVKREGDPAPHVTAATRVTQALSVSPPPVVTKPVVQPNVLSASTPKSANQQWGVQVARLSQTTNIQLLAQKLTQKGFTVRQQTVRLPSGNRVTELWVGVSAQQAQAKQAAAKLHKTLKLTGKVMLYHNVATARTAG